MFIEALFTITKTWNQPKCPSCQVMPDSCNPMDCILPGSSVHGFLRQEHWSGLRFPSPGDLPSPGIEPMSPAWQADSTEPPGKLTMKHYSAIKKNEIMLFAATRMNLEIITLTEVS